MLDFKRKYTKKELNELGIILGTTYFNRILNERNLKILKQDLRETGYLAKPIDIVPASEYLDSNCPISLDGRIIKSYLDLTDFEKKNLHNFFVVNDGHHRIAAYEQVLSEKSIELPEDAILYNPMKVGRLEGTKLESKFKKITVGDLFMRINDHVTKMDTSSCLPYIIGLYGSLPECEIFKNLYALTKSEIPYQTALCYLTGQTNRPYKNLPGLIKIAMNGFEKSKSTETLNPYNCSNVKLGLRFLEAAGYSLGKDSMIMVNSYFPLLCFTASDRGTYLGTYDFDFVSSELSKTDLENLVVCFLANLSSIAGKQITSAVTQYSFDIDGNREKKIRDKKTETGRIFRLYLKKYYKFTNWEDKESRDIIIRGTNEKLNSARNKDLFIFNNEMEKLAKDPGTSSEAQLKLILKDTPIITLIDYTMKNFK